MPMQPQGSYGYGSAPGFEASGSPYAAVKPSPFVRGGGGMRRPLNLAAVMLAVMIPWTLFSFLFAVCSFTVHYSDPLACKLILIGTVVVIAYFGYSAFLAYRSGDGNWTWYTFFFVSCILAYVAALILGNQNYFTNMRPYFDITNLSVYPSVDPANTKGQQLMDMGSVAFTEGSHLELTKSMGFR